MLNRDAVVKAGGFCALLGVSAGIAGAVVGAVHGLGGQEIPLGTSADFASLVQRQPHYLVREWLFLAYVIFGIGEGVGLYYLTRRAGGTALWAFAAFSSGIFVGIVQDAAVVAFVRQFPAEYAAANAPTRLALESFARTVTAIVGVQQAVSNVLLGIGVALYSAAILRTGVASKWFALSGFLAAAAGVFYGVVTATAPHLNDFHAIAEHAFGLVVLWDVWAAVVMLTRGVQR